MVKKKKLPQQVLGASEAANMENLAISYSTSADKRNQ